jgi:hypothetical protein
MSMMGTGGDVSNDEMLRFYLTQAGLSIRNGGTSLAPRHSNSAQVLLGQTLRIVPRPRLSQEAAAAQPKTSLPKVPRDADPRIAAVLGLQLCAHGM